MLELVEPWGVAVRLLGSTFGEGVTETASRPNIKHLSLNRNKPFGGELEE